MKKLEDIMLLTYLNVNNPWRWKSNIEHILNISSETDFFKIYNEICFAYHISSNVSDSIFKKDFEEIFERRVIDPEIETKILGKGARGLADLFFEERKKIYNQTLNDMKKIYGLWKLTGLQRGLAIEFYPNDLDELFE